MRRITLFLCTIISAHGYVNVELRHCSLRCHDDGASTTSDVTWNEVTNHYSALNTIKNNRSSTREKAMRSSCPQTSYKFPRQTSSDYIRVNSPIPTSNELTICMWVKQGQFGSGQMTGTVVSYATTTNFNTFTILYFGSNMRFLIHGTNEVNIALPLDKGVNNFICFLNARSEGLGKIYYNGTIVKTVNFDNREPIPSGGALLIGQEQDAYFGGFDSSQAFTGEIKNFMIWDRVLTDDEIEGMFQSKCNCAAGHLAALTLDQIQLVGAVTALHIEDDCP